MKGFCVVAVGIVIALLPGAVAKAQTPQQIVGSTLVKFPIPADQCEVSDRTKAGAFFTKKMREILSVANLTVLSIHADCDQLRLYSEGGSIGIANTGVYNTTNSAIQSVASSTFLSQLCASYKDYKDKEIPLSRQQESAIDRAVAGLKLGRTFLGVLSEDDNACYTATVGRVTSGATNQEFLQINISADLLVKGKYIVYDLHAPFRNRESIAELLALHKANVAAFIAANTQ